MKTCKGLFILLPVFLLFISGCQKDQPSEVNALDVRPEKVVQVSIEVAQAQEMVETFTLPGSLEAWEDLTLSAELAGPVRWVGPKEGERLIKGEEILKIDANTLLSNFERDRISYETRSRKLERYESLVAEQLVSQQEFDDMKYAVAEARADLRAAELQLQKSTLRTPVAGILDNLFIDYGEYIVPGQALARIVQVDRLKVLVDVPEKDVSYLKVGDKIKIVGAVIDGKEAATRIGRIQSIAYTADPATRTYRTKIEIGNADGDLRPGKIVRTYFKRRSLQQALSAPLYALVERDGQKVLFLEDRGRAHMTTVVTGAVIGQRVVIEQGLSVGDRIIVKGQQLLADGALIAVEGE